MKTQSEALQEISEIKNIMERSSRFISLSGLSGIAAGIYALGAALAAYLIAYKKEEFPYNRVVLDTDTTLILLIIGVITLILAVGTGVVLSYRKAKRNQETFWNSASKRLVINLAIPLVTGGIFSLIMIQKGMPVMVAPITLIFYGLSLINASKYTLHEIRSLGVVEILLGLTASVFTGYGILFWALGFGVLHILYGGIMYFKYEQ